MLTFTKNQGSQIKATVRFTLFHLLVWETEKTDHVGCQRMSTQEQHLPTARENINQHSLLKDK